MNIARQIPRLQRSHVCMRCLSSSSPATPPAPPMLLKLRADLKTAMKSKDVSRLNVLRSVLADVTNAAKTSSPIKSDLQLLSVLRKRAAASKAASQEFQDAGRTDLVDRENEQTTVLEEYAGGVQVMGAEEIRKFVDEKITRLRNEGAKVDMGSVTKALLGPGGDFDGASVEKAEVAREVKAALTQ
ncbi:MAG: hypothetical protein M1820_002886 [Bogoriella megaspora]|nr:MAG: hypothetical protein M1820_002886 [Bogoriella megaspora]